MENNEKELEDLIEFMKKNNFSNREIWAAESDKSNFIKLYNDFKLIENKISEDIVDAIRELLAKKEEEILAFYKSATPILFKITNNTDEIINDVEILSPNVIKKHVFSQNNDICGLNYESLNQKVDFSELCLNLIGNKYHVKNFYLSSESEENLISTINIKEKSVNGSVVEYVFRKEDFLKRIQHQFVKTKRDIDCDFLLDSLSSILIEKISAKTSIKIAINIYKQI